MVQTVDPPQPVDGAVRHRWRGHLLGVATVAIFLGALAIRSGIVFGIVLVALVFVPMEKIWSLHPRKVLRDGWKTDLVHFVANNLLSTVGIVVAVVAAGGVLHALVPEAVRGAIDDQALWLQTLEAFAIAEVAQYWAHRATHTVPILWRFHKVHHSIHELDWLAAARLHPIDQAFTRSCLIVPLYALGFTRGAFGALLVVFTLQALFVHANVRFTFGPLRYVVATPEFHHWHHADDPRRTTRTSPVSSPCSTSCSGRCTSRRIPAAAGRPATGSRSRCPPGTSDSSPGRSGARGSRREPGRRSAPAQARRVVARVGLLGDVAHERPTPPAQPAGHLVQPVNGSVQGSVDGTLHDRLLRLARPRRGQSLFDRANVGRVTNVPGRAFPARGRHRCT